MSTINNYLRNIKVFINFCYNSRFIKNNVSEKIKEFKHSRKPKEEITDEDFEKLMKVMDLTIFAEYRDYVIIQLLMDIGMRIGENLALKIKDVLIDKRAIFISADIAKGRKDRYVFYSLTMQKYLKRWIDYKDRYFDTELLFVSSRNNPLTVSSFQKNIKKYVNRAKLNKNVTVQYSFTYEVRIKFQI